MKVELNEIYNSLSKATAVLSGMTDTFCQAFGLPTISEDQALAMMQKGKRVEI